MDIKKTRLIRAELRTCLPAYAKGIVDDDSLSAVLATLCELLTFRVMNSIGQVPRDKSMALMEEVSGLVSTAMETFLSKHLPDAKFYREFRPPGDVPPGNG